MPWWVIPMRGIWARGTAGPCMKRLLGPFVPMIGLLGSAARDAVVVAANPATKVRIATTLVRQTMRIKIFIIVHGRKLWSSDKGRVLGRRKIFLIGVFF